MRYSLTVYAALSLMLGGLLAGCGTTKSILSHTYHALPFTGSAAPAATPPGAVSKRAHNLALKLQLSPVPLKLSDTRQIDVRIRLENVSKKFVQLQFPTTQRIDVLILDDTGKTIVKWSEDRIFAQSIDYVGINPGEHVEYTASVPTRDLQAGKRYVVQGLFPSFSDLKAEEALVPEP